MTSAGNEPAPRSTDRKVRITVDLAREQHRFLRRFSFDAEADASSVLRALIALLEEDEGVARKVLARTERRYTD
jgi:hypothetical protein